MDVAILPSAQKDLQRCYYFYARRETSVGKYFHNALYADIQALRKTGGIHSKRGRLFRVKSKFFPHWLYYGIIDEVAYVVAILDARQAPEKIRKREKREQAFGDDQNFFNA